MSYCATCNEYLIFPDDPHKCPPRWWVWYPDYHGSVEEAVPVYAIDEEAAAEKFIDRWDCEESEYPIAHKGESALVFVAMHSMVPFTVPERDVTGIPARDWKPYSVEGEFVPEYHAYGPKKHPRSFLEGWHYTKEWDAIDKCMVDALGTEANAWRWTAWLAVALVASCPNPRYYLYGWPPCTYQARQLKEAQEKTK